MMMRENELRIATRNRSEKPLDRKDRALLFTAILAGVSLFALCLGGIGPTSQESVSTLALQKSPVSRIISAPLIDDADRLVYRPCVALAAKLLTSLVGTNVPVSRMVVLLLHGLGVWLVFQVIKRLFGSGPGAAAALIFAVHPVHAVSYCSPLTGLEGILGLIAFLAGLLCIAAYRDRCGERHLVASMLCMTLAGLSCELTGLPVLVLFFDLRFVSRLERSHSAKSLLSVQAPLWFLLGASFAVRFLVLGEGFDLDGGVLRTAALLSIGPWWSAQAFFWPSVVLSSACALLLALLLVVGLLQGRGRFCRSLGRSVFLFLAVAALPASRLPDNSGLPLDTGLLLAFASAAAGMIILGHSRGGPRRVRYLQVAILVAITASCALTSLELGASLREADRTAARAADEIRVALEGQQPKTVLLYNHPLTVRAGRIVAARFLRNDLALRINSRRKGAVKPYRCLPLHNDPRLMETAKTLLHMRSGAKSFVIGEDGSVSAYRLTQQRVFDAVNGVFPAPPNSPREGSRTAYRRNGFPVSFIPPRNTRSIRIVVLTPFGPCLSDTFNTRIRYHTGHETLYVRNGWLDRYLALFEAAVCIVWAEIDPREGRLAEQVRFESESCGLMSPTVLIYLGREKTRR